MPKIEYSYESIFPVENIPDSAKDAEMMLLVDSKWEYRYTQNGIDVYVCKTLLSLYDAAGQFQGVVGSSFHTLSGFVMVRGSTYYPAVDEDDIKSVIAAWVNSD